MKLEDYAKYYIQGSDHYLIPKDDFIELFNEMVSWREETIELKKQLEKRTKMYQNAYNYSQKMEGKAIILETQQKEFIKYLKDEIERKRLNATCKFEYNDTVLPLKEILQKYKEIVNGTGQN